MINILELIEQEQANGYSAANASAKICQDLVLRALASGPLNRNVTIKGGVVMRSKTGNVRRATQDLDIDFIRYSLSEDSIERFIQNLNCLPGIIFTQNGNIEELKQQEYHGKRVHVLISDSIGNEISSKIDLGVHKRFEIEQEEYCFDIALDDEGASLLVNSNEQMFSEKLRSLLKFGAVSTRYKDFFDIYYLISRLNIDKLAICFDSYIFNDLGMRETDMESIVKRVKMTFKNKLYRRNLSSTNKKWLDEDISQILDNIVSFLASLKFA